MPGPPVVSSAARAGSVRKRAERKRRARLNASRRDHV